MAKKRVAAIVKIQIPAGKATPAPPVGTALGPHGIAIMDFVKAYNAATEAQVGTVVPVEIMSNIPGTSSIAVLVDKNPFPLAGKFDFMEGALPFVKVNLKMGETSEVRVVATAGGRNYVATKEIKVTIGGCGG